MNKKNRNDGSAVLSAAGQEGVRMPPFSFTGRRSFRPLCGAPGKRGSPRHLSITECPLVTAGVLAAAVAFTVVMMIAAEIRICIKGACKECCYRLICVAGNASVKLDACSRKAVLCSRSDAAAKKHVNPQILKHPCKGAVALTVGVNHLRGSDHPVCHIIYFKKLRMTEMLKYLSVFVSYADSHNCSSFFVQGDPAPVLNLTLFIIVGYEHMSITK